VAELFLTPEDAFRYRSSRIRGMFRSIFTIHNGRAGCVFLVQRVRLRRALKLLGIALLLIGQFGVTDESVLLAATKDTLTWDAVFAWIQRDWPEVAQMSTRELAERMAASNQAAPLLIDVRTLEEYEVSHLPGAIWAETPSQIAFAVRGASDRQAVVLYCSVGVRSSKAAAKLIQSGRANVFNLQGSIFQWANEGRPLIANEHTVHVVHPYNERWGILLNPQLHSRGSN
jgi:rhodanese-related sulfurtransferase